MRKIEGVKVGEKLAFPGFHELCEERLATDVTLLPPPAGEREVSCHLFPVNAEVNVVKTKCTLQFITLEACLVLS